MSQAFPESTWIWTPVDPSDNICPVNRLQNSSAVLQRKQNYVWLEKCLTDYNRDNSFTQSVAAGANTQGKHCLL